MAVLMPFGVTAADQPPKPASQGAIAGLPAVKKSAVKKPVRKLTAKKPKKLVPKAIKRHKPKNSGQ